MDNFTMLLNGVCFHLCPGRPNTYRDVSISKYTAIAYCGISYVTIIAGNKVARSNGTWSVEKMGFLAWLKS